MPPTPPARWAALALAAAMVAPVIAAPDRQGQGRPVFKAGVDLVRVDVQVVSDDGLPILGLSVDDFRVALDGKDRRVVSADLVSFARRPDDALEEPMMTPGVVPEDSRVYIIAIDQMGLAAAAVLPMKDSLRQFMRQLRPQDMVGVYEFPFRQPVLDITHDRLAVSIALDRVIGMRDWDVGTFNLSPSEIAEITARDAETLRRVVARECPTDPLCPQMVSSEANGLAGYLEAEAAQRLSGLSTLARSLAYIPGRKTVVLLSGGLINSDRATGRPDLRSVLDDVGREVADSETSLYVLHLDSTYMDAYSAANGPTARPGERFLTVPADRFTTRLGLEWLAGRAGGTLLSVQAGTPQWALDRVLRETTAYYLLSIAPEEVDRDGKTHFIHVRTTAKGATVRSRVRVAIPERGTR